MGGFFIVNNITFESEILNLKSEIVLCLHLTLSQKWMHKHWIML